MTTILSACCNGQHIPAEFGTFDPVEHVSPAAINFDDVLISQVARGLCTNDPADITIEFMRSRPCGIKEALLSGLADTPAQGEHHRRAHHGNRHHHDGDAQAGWDVRASSPA